ncbi:hypothetical protein IFR05_016537, partial [Cadophora sp. M221]
ATNTWRAALRVRTPQTKAKLQLPHADNRLCSTKGGPERTTVLLTLQDYSHHDSPNSQPQKHRRRLTHAIFGNVKNGAAKTGNVQKNAKNEGYESRLLAGQYSVGEATGTSTVWGSEHAQCGRKRGKGDTGNGDAVRREAMADDGENIRREETTSYDQVRVGRPNIELYRVKEPKNPHQNAKTTTGWKNQKDSHTI